jgi:hypothetical protein
MEIACPRLYFGDSSMSDGSRVAGSACCFSSPLLVEPVVRLDFFSEFPAFVPNASLAAASLAGP